MRYVGGKSKLAGKIADVILSTVTEREVYIEPFIGGASVFAKVAPAFDVALASDLQPDVAALWRGVFEEGFVPPEIVTEAEYAALRDTAPSALRGYVGFGGSFGGKFFGGYARGGFTSTGSPRNHQGESARAIMRIGAVIDGRRVSVDCRSFEAWAPVAGDVVYCDPPYASTQGYATGAFDSKRFWRVLDGWRDRGSHVFVSEYRAPKRWPILAEFDHRQSLTSHRLRRSCGGRRRRRRSSPERARYRV